MSLKAIDKNITTISTSIADVNNLVHVTAVMIMEHATEPKQKLKNLNISPYASSTLAAKGGYVKFENASSDFDLVIFSCLMRLSILDY